MLSIFLDGIPRSLWTLICIYFTYVISRSVLKSRKSRPYRPKSGYLKSTSKYPQVAGFDLKSTVMSKPRWRMGSDLGSSSSSSSPELVVDDDAVYSPIARSDSQSSLGANSIRDMNMSRSLEREHRLSPISRLPPELLCSIFGILKDSISDLRNCALVSKRWSENCIEILWQRPSCNTWKNLLSVVAAVQNPLSYYAYNHLVKRINLSNLGDQVSNGSVRPFIHCKRIERLTLTGCIKLTDRGVTSLVEGSKCLLALDITGLDSVTDHTLLTVATHCPRLQGLNITDCSKITDESLVAVAHACRYLKRVNRPMQSGTAWVLTFFEAQAEQLFVVDG